MELCPLVPCPVWPQTRSFMKWNQIYLERNGFYLIYSPPLSLISLLPPHNNQFSLLNPGVWSNHPIVAFYLTVVVLTVSILFYFHLFQIISFIVYSFLSLIFSLLCSVCPPKAGCLACSTEGAPLLRLYFQSEKPTPLTPDKGAFN